VAISFVKNVGSLATKTSGTVFSITVPAAGVAAGSRVICRLGSTAPGGSTITGSDTRGNTYAKDNPGGVQSGSPQSNMFVVSAHIATALVSGDTISLTLSAASPYTALVVDEFTGITSNSPYTTTPDSRGEVIASTPTAVSLYTATVGDLLALTSFEATGSGTTVAYPAGWTALTSAGNTGGSANTNRNVFGAWQLATSTGSTAAVTSVTPQSSATTYFDECLFGYLAAVALNPTYGASVGTTALTYGATGATATTVTTVAPSGNVTSTADVIAIQNAVQSASNAGGGIVRLTSGATYYLNGSGGSTGQSSAIGMRAGVTLDLNGATIKAGTNFFAGATAYSGYSMVSTMQNNNITIKNGTFDHSGDTLNGNVTGRLSAYMVESRGSTNVVIDGITTKNPFTYSIAVLDTVTGVVRNCKTSVSTAGKYNQLDGIHLLNSSRIDVVDNTADQSFGGATGDGDDGIALQAAYGGTGCHDVAVKNNLASGGHNGSDLQLAGGDYPVYNVVVQNNNFYGTAAGRGLRTGNYGTGNVAIHDVTVGGSFGLGNDFIGCTAYAVDLSALPGTNEVVTYNRTNAGAFTVPTGTGNVNSNNATVTPPPPTTPVGQFLPFF